MKNKYRIVTDRYLGYEVQIKYWWWPFWTELHGVNTYPSVESAARAADRHMKRENIIVSDVEEYLRENPT